jgi:dCTP deaminase
VSVYSDREIAALYPHYRGAIGPASIDLAIGDDLRSWPRYERRDPRRDQSALWNAVSLQADDLGSFWVLVPGVRYLATTRERLCIPDDAAGQIGARSSWGRDGLAVIQGPAGWLDPGFCGKVVLELSVLGSELVLWPGAVVCQLILFQLSSPCLQPYAGRYQGQADVTPSRLHLDWTSADA